MKTIFIILIFIFCILKASSQNLAGMWEGSFMIGELKISSQPIFLEFLPDGDSSYTVRTMSREKYIDGRDTTSIYQTQYKKKGSKNIILDETKLISPDTLKRVCFMRLQLRYFKQKGKARLIGNYYSLTCTGSGDILFVKQEE